MCAFPCIAQSTMLENLQTTIRVKFSDRSQLEKTFQSTNKIKAVYAFVRNSLREDVKPIKFVLCASLAAACSSTRAHLCRRPDTPETRIQGI